MFKKYNSIENAYRKAYLARLQMEGFGVGEYVVQEKIHGSNLSYATTDGVQFTTYKRNGPVAEGENFYNHEQVLAGVESKLQRIWSALRADRPGLKSMVVYGEIFGGAYPHPDVKRTKDAMRIQKGVFYTPDNLFYAFDLRVDDEYFGVDKANTLFAEVDLLHAQTLFRGSLEEALDYPNAFNSTLPAILDLPDIGENIAEGTVIRPVVPCFLGNGSRVILKNKNEKWAEKAKRKPSKTPDPLNASLVALRDELLEYITPNRLSNVLSKEGTVSFKDFGKILGAFNQDYFEDFAKDNPETLVTVEKADLKLVRKLCNREAAKLVRQRLLVEC